MVLKFAKLHDGFDFDDQIQLRSYFDVISNLDFMRYDLRRAPLLPSTINGMVKAYNDTPNNFGVPSDETINEVIRLVIEQISIDDHNEMI